MEQLYAPWRTSYTTSTARSKNDDAHSDECVFCAIIKDNNDAVNFVLKRNKNTFVLLNRYPYNAGHVLVLPYAHSGLLEELSREIQHELIDATTACVRILKTALKCDGINLGMNLGKAAGAGIPAHLHMHALPRWQGDTSFLPAIGEIKSISCDLNLIYQDLKPHFEQL